MKRRSVRQQREERRRYRRKWKRRNPLKWKAQIIVNSLRSMGIFLTRNEVLSLMEDSPSCSYCGELIKARDYSVDHITPRSRGGPDKVENIHLICKSCNLMKGNLLDSEFRELLAYLKTRPSVYKILKQRLKASGVIYKG